MKPIDVSAQGLDFRSPDRTAPMGACRTLANLHPTGPVDAPVWKPTYQPEIFLEPHAVGKIKCFHAWHRSNRQSAVVYLFQSTAEGDHTRAKSGIFLRPVDSNGRTVGTTTALYEFPQLPGTTVDPERTGQFAQVGDILIVEVRKSGEPGEVYLVSVIDGVDVCLPLNLPYEPTGISVNVGGGTSLTTSATKASIAGHCGIRLAFELVDGTYVRATGVAWLGTLATDKKIIVTMPQIILSSTDPWLKLIRGVAVFLSDMQSDYEAVLQSSLWRYVGTMSKVFAGEDTLTIDMFADDLPLKTPLNEDCLTVHDIKANGIFSYNKLLLLHGIHYRFRSPGRADVGRGTTTGDVTSIPFPVESLRVHSATYPVSVTWAEERTLEVFEVSADIRWTNPDIADTLRPIERVELQRSYAYSIEGYIEFYVNPSTGLVERRYVNERITQDPEWVQVSTAALEGYVDEFNIMHMMDNGLTFSGLVLRYRARVVYSDGQASVWKECSYGTAS